MSRRRNSERLDRVIRHIFENIESSMSLAELASVAALSTHHFSRQFKAITGMSPMRYVLQCRVDSAKLILAASDAMNAEVAYRCGFSSQSHFCTAFKSITGQTVTEWRESLRLPP
jgi:AraC family transcriptional regulator